MANLPGVYTLYKEKKPAVAVSNEPTTDEILVFGTATDGPVLTPVTITRPADGIATFGGFPVDGNGNPTVPVIDDCGSPLITAAVNEAYYAGARRITCVRVSGVDASLEVKTAGGVTLFTAYGKFPGAKYNNVRMLVESNKLKVWNVADALLLQTNSAKLPTFEYDLTVITTLRDLATAINANQALGDLRIVVATGQENTATLGLTTAVATDGAATPADVALTEGVTLLGGDDELTPELGTYLNTEGTGYGDGYRGMLARAYDLFFEYDAELVIPLGVCIGFRGATPTYDKTDALELAKFCFEAAMRNNDIIGVIGVAPLSDTTLSGISAFCADLVAADNTYVVDGVDLGRYINIVVGEPVFNDTAFGGNYINLSPACYFGLASSLPVQSGTTNKVIANAVNLRYNFSPAQTEALKDNKFTVLRYKVGRGVVVIEGLLASLASSDFQALSTVRIIHGMMKSVRSATDPFIGEPLDIPHVNSIETAIRDVIATFAKNGAVTNGTFQLFFGGNNSIVGDIDVELELEIPSELRRILVTVSRKFPNLTRQQ